MFSVVVKIPDDDDEMMMITSPVICRISDVNIGNICLRFTAWVCMRWSRGTGIDDDDDGLEELDDDDGGDSRPQVEHSTQHSNEREGGELRHLHVLPM